MSRKEGARLPFAAAIATVSYSLILVAFFSWRGSGASRPQPRTQTDAAVTDGKRMTADEAQVSPSVSPSEGGLRRIKGVYGMDGRSQ